MNTEFTRKKIYLFEIILIFLDKWEEIVQMIFKKEKKIIVSHPIVSGYFRNLKYVLGDRIEIIENNPREQLAISLGLGSNELDFFVQ